MIFDFFIRSIQLNWTGQYTKGVQHDFKFTSEYGALYCRAVKINNVK